MIHDIRKYLEPPMPVGLQLATFGAPGAEWTVIARKWRREDIPLCTLCPVCSANPDGAFCTLVVPGRVHPRDAARYEMPDDGPHPRIRPN